MVGPPWAFPPPYSGNESFQAYLLIPLISTSSLPSRCFKNVILIRTWIIPTTVRKGVLFAVRSKVGRGTLFPVPFQMVFSHGPFGCWSFLHHCSPIPKILQRWRLPSRSIDWLLFLMSPALHTCPTPRYRDGGVNHPALTPYTLVLTH